MKTHLQTIEGFLFWDAEGGIAVALDNERRDVRFIGRADILEITETAAGAGAATGAIPLEPHPQVSLGSVINREIDDTLDRISFDEVRRIHARLRGLHDKYQGYLEFTSLGSRLFVCETWLGDLPEIRDSYRSLVDELTKAGMMKILAEHDEAFRRIAGPLSLPLLDAALLDSATLESFIETSKRLGVDDSPRLTDERMIVALMGLVSDDAITKFETKVRADKEARNLPYGATLDSIESQTTKKTLVKATRIISASTKLLAGAGLLAGNITLGCFAGVLQSLPSLAMGTVAGATAVAASCYTGLNGASDGLKELGNALE